MPNIDGPPHDLGRLIEVLDRHGVEYLMVGGVAAIGYGARAGPSSSVVRHWIAGRDPWVRLRL